MATNDEPLGVEELEANLNDIEKPPELPNGTYKGEIQNVERRVSSAGNDYWAIQVRIPQEEIPPDLQEFFEDGAVFTWNRIMVPGRDRRRLYNLQQFIKAIGLDANTTSVDPNEWMGAEALWVIKSSPYQGEMRAGIVSIKPSEEAAAPAKKVVAGRRKSK